MYRKRLSSRLMRSTQKMNGKTLGELPQQRISKTVERPLIDIYPLLGAASGLALAIGTAHNYLDFKILILREKLEYAKAKLEQVKEETGAKKRPETAL